MMRMGIDVTQKNRDLFSKFMKPMHRAYILCQTFGDAILFFLSENWKYE